MTPRDDDARRRIETDLDANLCVEAGAGTGKTTVLVRRVVALLRSGAARVDDLGVITFTEKAAGELSARVRFALEQALDDPALDEAERERVEQALRDLYRGRIQTIHAFAADILRERPVEARLDPQFETFDDLHADIDLEDAYRRWLDRQLASRNPPVERAMRRDFDLRKLRRLAEAVHRNREALPLADVEWTPPDMGGFRVAAASWAAQLAELAPRCRDTEDRAYASLVAVRGFCEEVARAVEDADIEQLVLVHAPQVDARYGQASNWEDDACESVKQVLRQYRARIGELGPALRTDALVGLLPLAADFAEWYAEERRKEGKADFDDLLIWARDLLRDDPRVREHFHRRTPRVLVDEFQDTDPVQAELIAWLCAPPGATGRWRGLEPVPGSLFVVGDPKQSIYRFRGADMAVYDAVKDGPLVGRLEYLVQNFRSSDELLHWVNRLFDRVMAGGTPGIQPPHAALYGNVSMAGEIGRPPVVVVRSAERPDRAAAVRDVEAGLLARAIRRAVVDERWRVRDRHAGDAVREAQWRDVAVLVPSRTGIERLEAALQRYGVPYRFEGGRGFFARQEVRDMVSLLHAIDDPTDGISIVAALRSLAFGCSDEDLLLWQLEHGRFDYRIVDDETGGPVAVREAMVVLRELSYAARGLSLAELVRRTIEDTGMVEAALSLPSGAQGAANVMKLLDHARAFSAAGTGSLRAFTGWLARQRDREREGDEVDAPVAEERDDTVRVMTVHGAKGLEFPIVCLGNVESPGSNQMDPVRDVEERRIELKLGSEKSEFCTPGWPEVKGRERDALAAERDRMLYVACTRARDHLVVPVVGDVVEARAKGFMDRLKDSLDDRECWQYDAGRLEQVASVAAEDEVAAEEAAVSTAAAEREAWLGERDALVREAAREIEIVTASGVKVDPRPLARVAETAAGSGSDADDAGPSIDVNSTPPLELGDAFHRVMEKVALPDGGDVEELAQAICAEAAIPQAVGLVMEMARRCLSSDVVRRAIASGDVHREVPFVVQEDGRVLIGRIDLLFRDGARAVVVDYKTDAVQAGGEAVLAERHRGQAETYRHAAAQTLGLDADVVLLFTRTGAALPID